MTAKIIEKQPATLWSIRDVPCQTPLKLYKPGGGVDICVLVLNPKLRVRTLFNLSKGTVHDSSEFYLAGNVFENCSGSTVEWS